MTTETNNIETYDYSWNTPEKIIENIKTVRYFTGWGTVTCLSNIAETDDPEVYRSAHALWLKLKEAYNAEAEWYGKDPETSEDDFDYLGSIGDVTEREVTRSMWFDELHGEKYGDYEALTRIIEALHGHEKLETGTIYFGS